MTSVPTRPPPGPLSPGLAVFGRRRRVAARGPRRCRSRLRRSVMTSMPSALYAGDARIFGTSRREEAVGRDEPAGLAVDARRVVPVVAHVRRDEGEVRCRGGRLRDRSRARSKSTTFCLHAGESMIEWKYTNGSCRVAYMSPGLGTIVVSFAPIGRVPARRAHVLHVPPPRLARRRQLVGDRLHRLRVHAALAERLAVLPGRPRCRDVNSMYFVQSPCVVGLGACPLISAM